MILENLYTPDSIRMHSGMYVNVFDPNPDTINIEDIAIGLSRACRFVGQTKDVYTVAEHCIWVANIVPREQKLAGLLHDASEAYLSDIAKPIKEKLPDYNIIENRLMHCIAKKFGFQWPMTKEVKEADRMALEYEWEHKVLRKGFKSLSPAEAKRLFLVKFQKYGK